MDDIKNSEHWLKYLQHSLTEKPSKQQLQIPIITLALKLHLSFFVQQLLSASTFRLCFSIYRFLAFSIKRLFRSWNDRLLSWADFPKQDAAFVGTVPEDFEVVADDCCMLLEVEGKFFCCWDSGMYRTWPSRMLEIVWSTFFVFTEKIKHMLYIF